MSQIMSPSSQPSLRVFAKDTLIKGQPPRSSVVEILGQTFSITRGRLSQSSASRTSGTRTCAIPRP